VVPSKKRKGSKILHSHILRRPVFEIHVTAKWVAFVSSVMPSVTKIRHDAAKILASTDARKYEPRCRRRQGDNFWSSVAVRQNM